MAVLAWKSRWIGYENTFIAGIVFVVAVMICSVGRLPAKVQDEWNSVK
jgi:hypothetical protein